MTIKNKIRDYKHYKRVKAKETMQKFGPNQKMYVKLPRCCVGNSCVVSTEDEPLSDNSIFSRSVRGIEEEEEDGFYPLEKYKKSNDRVTGPLNLENDYTGGGNSHYILYREPIHGYKSSCVLDFTKFWNICDDVDRAGEECSDKKPHAWKSSRAERVPLKCRQLLEIRDATPDVSGADGPQRFSSISDMADFDDASALDESFGYEDVSVDYETDEEDYTSYNDNFWYR